MLGKRPGAEQDRIFCGVVKKPRALHNPIMTQLMCPDCSLPVASGEMNCPKCGQHKSYFVKVKDRESESLCKYCETENTPNEKFCQRCGSPNWALTKEDIRQAEIQERSKKLGQGKNLADCTEKELLIVLIREQRKTTHATRSLAITFVAAPVIALVVAVALVLAAKSGNIAIMVVAGIFGIIALIWVLARSLEELTLSKLD